MTDSNIKKLTQVVPWLMGMAGMILLGFSLDGYWHQHKRALNRTRYLQLEQIGAAIHSFARDNPEQILSWPNKFMAGRNQTTILCQVNSQSYQVFDLANELKNYLEKFPFDPRHQLDEVSFYAFERSSLGWKLIACEPELKKNIEYDLKLN